MPIPFSAVGTIATAPKLLTAENRAAFCTFRIACNDRRYDREQGKWVDGDTNWLTVNAFRSLAHHAEQSFATGDRVIVQGRLRVRRWENSEKSGVSVEVDADALGHDLRWGVTRFSKRSASSSTEEPGSHQGSDAAVDSHGSEATTDHTSQAGWLTTSAGSGSALSDESTADGFTPEVAA